MGTLGVITSLARSIENGMPSELCDAHPGYRTVAQVKGSAARKKTPESPGFFVDGPERIRTSDLVLIRDAL